jgi:CRT-like, chloroquine-resistance transporter-like
VLGTKIAFPDRKYSLDHMKGAGLITLAVILTLIGYVAYPSSKRTSVHHSDVCSCLLYVAMAGLHGVSTLYKEKSIIAWARPMDIHYLSSWLFMYQFLFSLLLAPFIYYMQGETAIDSISLLSALCYIPKDTHSAQFIISYEPRNHLFPQD